MDDNPYLAGPYAPVHDELVADRLEVVGEVPADLNGVYLRNGPNRRFAAEGRYHWFDGDGMVHALSFDGGHVTYRNRWVRTAAWQAEDAAGEARWTGVMEPPVGNPPGNERGLPYKDSANTDLCVHRGRVLATWYLCGTPYVLDPVSLATLGPDDFGGTRKGDVMAHTKLDEATGELFWFDYGPTPPYLRYGVTGPDGTVTHHAEVDLPGARMPHDMALTEHHAVLMDLPLYADPEAARHGRHKIVFDRSLPSRFAVLPRHGTGADVQWFEADPCYIYHVVNAWEQGHELVLDVCRVTRPAPEDAAGKGPLAKLLAYLKLDARLHRYRFDLATGACTEEQLDDANTEFPAVDARRIGNRARWAYNVHLADADTNLFDGLVRYDLDAGTSETWMFPDGWYGSEVAVAPRSADSAEDDAYLVSFVTDAAGDRSEAHVFDAARLADGPVGRVLLPQRVPLGFHACWIRPDQMAQAEAAS